MDFNKFLSVNLCTQLPHQRKPITIKEYVIQVWIRSHSFHMIQMQKEVDYKLQHLNMSIELK